jgi:hypothetical protein
MPRSPAATSRIPATALLIELRARGYRWRNDPKGVCGRIPPWEARCRFDLKLNQASRWKVDWVSGVEKHRHFSASLLISHLPTGSG